MIQAWIEKRTKIHSQTENQTDWLVHLTKSKGKAQISPTLP